MTDLTDTEREALEDALFDLLDGVHDNARHIHAAECCWPFPGAIAALATFVAAREAAAWEDGYGKGYRNGADLDPDEHRNSHASAAPNPYDGSKI